MRNLGNCQPSSLVASHRRRSQSSVALRTSEKHPVKLYFVSKLLTCKGIQNKLTAGFKRTLVCQGRIIPRRGNGE